MIMTFLPFSTLTQVPQFSFRGGTNITNAFSDLEILERELLLFLQNKKKTD